MSAVMPIQPGGLRRRVVQGVTRAALEHVIANLREMDRRELEATRFDGVSLAESVYLNQGAAYTAFDRTSLPACVGGVGAVSPGVAQAWLFGTDRIDEVGVAMTRQASMLLSTTLKSGVAHRIQAHSAAFHTDAHRWLHRLGFEVESTLRQWGKHREDFLMFVLLQTEDDHAATR